MTVVACSGMKMTGVSKTSLLIFVVITRFIALTTTFWQVCAQQCHKDTDNILNTTTKCGCYVTGGSYNTFSPALSYPLFSGVGGASDQSD